MDLCFVNNGSINDFYYNENEKADIFVFGFSALKDIDFEDELLAKSFKLEDFAVYSKEMRSVLISGCYTKSYSLSKRSVVVADNGKILGISDGIYIVEGDKFSAGSSLRVYETSAGRVGVLVAYDLYFFENVKTLSSLDCDVIICIFENINDDTTKLVARAMAFCFGVNIGVCSKGYSFVADIFGDIKYASSNKILKCKLDKQKKYSSIYTKVKGFSIKNKNSF